MYERLIGFVKMPIKKVLRRAIISLPELQTLIKEVQAVVNDRPITFVYYDTNDPEPLTSSKLLCDFDVTALPHPVVDSDEFADEDFNEHDQLNKALKRRSLLFQHYVRRFTLLCCGSVICISLRSEDRSRRFLKVGDAVLTHAENIPRSSWKLAILKKDLHGRDGLVRAAEIKTNSLTDPEELLPGTELQIPQVETLRRSKQIASHPPSQYVESGD